LGQAELQDCRAHAGGPAAWPALCPPRTPKGPPHRAPFTFLGRAVPPPGGNSPESGKPPRYLLRFVIPDLRPGPYAYVIWCDACVAGKRGSLLSFPATHLWSFTIR